MPKTLTDNFTTEKNKTTGAQPRTLLEIVTATGTVYYSDRSLTVSGQAYVSKVLSWPPILSQIVPGEQTINETGAVFELTNNPAIHTLFALGNKITVYAWYAGLTSADKVSIFVGKISEGIDITGRGNSKITIVTKGIWSFFTKILGTRLNKTDFPGTDPDDLGKIIPWGYGPFFNQPCLAIDAGAVTTVGANYTAGGGTITVTDTVNPIEFPNSGTFLLGDETGTYSGKTATTFTSVTGLTKSYTRGDRIMENAASVKYIVRDHICKSGSLTNARILPNGKTLKDAVTIPAGSVTLTEDDGGIATATLTDLLAISQQVNLTVTQQQTQGSPVHGHTQSNVTVSYIMNSISGSGITDINGARIVDGTTVEGATIQNVSSGDWLRAHKDLIENLGGSLVSAIVKTRAWTSSGTINYTLKYLFNGVTKISESKTATTSGTLFTTSSFSLSGGSWTDFQNGNTYIEIVFNTTTASAFYNAEMWLELIYTPANPTTAVTVAEVLPSIVGGNSVADILGGILIIDGEGYQDDGSGTFTGTPNALIQRPGHVIHHLIVTRSNGATGSDIDLANSFADVEANSPASYNFAFVTFEEIDMLILLNLLAEECWCRFRGDAGGLAQLNRRLTSGSGSKSLTADGLDLVKDNIGDPDDFKEHKPGLANVWNDIEILYNLDLTIGGWNNDKAYTENTKDDDATSISLYGTRKRTHSFFAVVNGTMADDLRDKYLAFYKLPHPEYILRSWARNIELDPTDLLELSYTDLGLDGNLCDLLEADYHPSSALEKKRTEIVLKMLYLLISNIAFPEAAQVGDALTKIDVDVVIPEAAQVGDALTKIDVDVVIPEAAQVGDAMAIDITIPQLADAVAIGDVLTQIKSLWKFDSTRQYDSTKKFNSAP